MLGLDGVLETGFPPENPDSYLADDSFIYLGLLKDLEAYSGYQIDVRCLGRSIPILEFSFGER